ncbi:MAG: deoxyribonuclease IV [Candidatus Kerfeldbacteria bacterium]|nr:deoxyribonuclease IV [Candidatus Kerfeldbacteria bacterium]
MLFGSHISAAGGVDKAPGRAREVGCEVFQFFSRPPQGGPAPGLTMVQIKAFKDNCKKFKQVESYIHAPYYINLASSKNTVRYGSSSAIRQELERGSQLGVKYLMTHIGSSRDVSAKQGIDYVVEGLDRILDGYQGTTQFLIEISAGAGKVIGDTFDEIAEMIKRTEKKKAALKNKIGVCFDTCHAFASGYDLRDKPSVKKTLDEFDKQVGLARLKLIHCNDSMAGLGEHKDRHEHLGKGKIGLKGFEALVNEPRLKRLNLVLETPKDTPQDDPRNLKILKKFRLN